jgi:hypothetical protein
MLKQIIIGGIVGGIALFIWGFISWAVMDWHFYTIQHDEGTRAVVENIETQLSETGVYYFPPLSADQHDAAGMEEYAEQFKNGPHGMIFYTAEHGEMMSPMRLARGFLVDVVASMMATVLLIIALPNLPKYGARVMYVLALGVFAVMSVHLVNGVFHDMPVSWTTGVALDLTASWLCAGLVLGAIVRPQKDA